MVEIGKKKYTYADYAKLPEGAPYQLICGELVKSPAPTVLHQEINVTLFQKLFQFQRLGKGKAFFAPLDVYLTDTETYQPDLMFITNERLDIIKEKNIQGAPDLVMEVLSPGTAYYDLRHKKDVYAEQGVREYWIVDPMERSIEVYTNRDGGFEQVDFVKQKGRVDSRVFSKLFVSAPELFGV